MPLSRLALFLLLALFLSNFADARAADLGSGPRQRPDAVASAADAAAAIEDYLSRRAVVLLIRAGFDVIPAADIPDILRRDLEALAGDAPGEWETADLDADLLTEAGYYLVSLRYLIESGGALWPSDRPESLYINDALVELDALKSALIEAVADGSDPLPLLARAQKIRWWTEGAKEVPSGGDRFRDRDALVEAALASHGPTTAI